MKRVPLIVCCCICWLLGKAQVLPAPSTSSEQGQPPLRQAQGDPPFAWKLSPRLRALGALAWKPAGYQARYLVQCSGPGQLRELAAGKKDSILIHYSYGNVFAITAYPQLAGQYLLPLSSVVFIDINERQAKEEVTINGFDYTADYINKVHSAYPALNGGGTVVSIKENKPDTSDIDFKGRYLSSPLSSSSISSHATIMGTIISGGGNSFYTARGVAWSASLLSSSFAVLLPDSDAAYRQYQVTVQNHSYGTGVENYYGADAAAYDASVNNNPGLLHVFSSGNSGNLASGSGAYAGISGFANLTGSFKMAKNILTVGSIDSFSAVPLLSSKGPAYDGRIKPDLVAYGEDGSSGAAALVSGSALMLQQIYKEQHGGAIADAALVKAVLLNTAGEAGNKGIDFSSGYGSLDAYRAVKEMQAAHFLSGSLAQGQSQSFSLSLPGNAQNLKLLLCWTDPAAPANAAKALVNDLDLTITHIPSSQSWQSWVLNSAANTDSLQLPPIRRRDSLNTAEQITIDNPPAGDYTIRVNGYAVPLGTQKFFVVYQWDTAGSFEWMYPAKNDNLLPGQPNLLRWQNNYTATGLLEYQFAGSNNWQTIAPAQALSNHYLPWTTPDTSATALLRMTINGKPYTSDTFTISPRPATGVGFNCPDSFLLYWNKSPAGNYVLYRLGNQYLEALQTLSDTSVILPVATAPSNWYAVAALLPYNKTGLRSFAFDYTQQGVDCYISGFTADLAGSAAALHLELGSNYHVVAVAIEKRYSGGYHPLRVFAPPVVLQYAATDDSLSRGLNIYRARITLSNGRTIYSDDQTVYYFGNGAYLIYPNPVAQLQSIHIIATELNNPVFQLFNTAGQKVAEKTLYNLVEDIPTAGLAKGLYFYVIRKNGQNDARGKIVVQ